MEPGSLILVEHLKRRYPMEGTEGGDITCCPQYVYDVFRVAGGYAGRIHLPHRTVPIVTLGTTSTEMKYPAIDMEFF